MKNRIFIKLFKLKSLMISILLLFCTNAVNAHDINMYPVSAIFAGDDIKNTTFYAGYSKNRQNYINTYISSFYKYFPNVVDKITDKNKFNTFAAYISIPRTSQIDVVKSEKLLDIYLPLTMSINFVNTTNGETLYTYLLTNYFKYSSTSDQKHKADIVQKLYKDNYEQTLNTVMSHASAEFKPFDIDTKIIDTYNDVYILNKGFDAGITKGDLLTDENSNQILVIYSDMDYSVGKSVFGKPDKDAVYKKYTNSSINNLKKPKILLINDFGDDKLYSIFSSALGNAAEFSLINTNKTYYDMETALTSLNSDFSIQNTYKKALPNYFLKIYSTPPFYAQYKSSKSYYNIDRYGMIACGVIFDITGRVVYSTCADNEFKNEVVGNLRFDDEANKEIIGKNVLIKLATNAQNDIEFKDINFKIVKAKNKNLIVSDPNGYLKRGNVLTVYKK